MGAPGLALGPRPLLHFRVPALCGTGPFMDVGHLDHCSQAQGRTEGAPPGLHSWGAPQVIFGAYLAAGYSRGWSRLRPAAAQSAGSTFQLPKGAGVRGAMAFFSMYWVR